MMPKTIAGDLGLSRGTRFISKAILFFENLQTGEASRSHAFACVGDNLVVEALVRVRVNSIQKYADQDFELWRLPLDDDERERFRISILKAAGDDYGWFKIALHAADSVASAVSTLFGRKAPVFFFTRRMGMTSYKVCSHLYVWALHKFTSYRIKDANHKLVEWRIVSPDYLQDLLHLPHNKAELLHKQTTPTP